MSNEKSGVPQVPDKPDVPEKPENAIDQPKKKGTKNPFKLMWHGVKYCCRKVRESPAAALVGSGVTAVGMVGIKAILDWKNRKEVEVTNPDPEPVETEFTDEYDNVAPPEDAAEE